MNKNARVLTEAEIKAMEENAGKLEQLVAKKREPLMREVVTRLYPQLKKAFEGGLRGKDIYEALLPDSVKRRYKLTSFLGCYYYARKKLEGTAQA